jgi:pantoate--beta-alanine ligase
LSISRSLTNAKMAALSGNNHSQEIKDQIVQALTEAGGQVDYVEVMVRGFFSSTFQAISLILFSKVVVKAFYLVM